MMADQSEDQGARPLAGDSSVSGRPSAARRAAAQRTSIGRFTGDHARDIAAMRQAGYYDPHGYEGRWPYCSHKAAAERRRFKAALGLDGDDYCAVVSDVWPPPPDTDHFPADWDLLGIRNLGFQAGSDE